MRDVRFQGVLVESRQCLDEVRKFCYTGRYQQNQYQYDDDVKSGQGDASIELVTLGEKAVTDADRKIGKQKAQHKRQQDRQQIIETYIDDRADDGDVYCVDNKFFTFFHIFIITDSSLYRTVYE